MKLKVKVLDTANLDLLFQKGTPNFVLNIFKYLINKGNSAGKNDVDTKSIRSCHTLVVLECHLILRFRQIFPGV